MYQPLELTILDEQSRPFLTAMRTVLYDSAWEGVTSRCSDAKSVNNAGPRPSKSLVSALDKERSSHVLDDLASGQRVWRRNICSAGQPGPCILACEQALPGTRAESRC